MRPRGAIQAIQLRIRSDFRRIIRAGRRRLNARRGENIRDDDISRERRGGTARTTDNEGARRVRIRSVRKSTLDDSYSKRRTRFSRPVGTRAHRESRSIGCAGQFNGRAEFP